MLRVLGRGPDFLPALKQSVSWKDTVYGVPFNVDVGLLYYWKEVNTSPPADLNDLLGKAHEMTGHGFEIGYSTQLDDYEGGPVNALELIWGFGGEVMSGDQVVIDKPQNRKAVEEALRALRNTQSPLKDGSQSAGSTKEASSIRAFTEQRAAFMRNWPYAFRVLAADPRMRDARHQLRFGVSPLPPSTGRAGKNLAGPTVLGGQNLAISTYTQDRENARKLVDFLTSPHSEHELFSCGGFAPTRYSAYSDRRPCPGSSSGEQQIDQSELAQLGNEIQLALRNARLRPATPAYQEFSEVFRRCIRSAVFGTTDIHYGEFAALLRNAYAGKSAPLNGNRPCG